MRPKENKDERKQKKIIPDVCSACKIHGPKSCRPGRDRLKIFLRSFLADRAQAAQNVNQMIGSEPSEEAKLIWELEPAEMLSLVRPQNELCLQTQKGLLKLWGPVSSTKV